MNSYERFVTVACGCLLGLLIILLVYVQAIRKSDPQPPPAINKSIISQQEQISRLGVSIQDLTRRVKKLEKGAN